MLLLLIKWINSRFWVWLKTLYRLPAASQGAELGLGSNACHRLTCSHRDLHPFFATTSASCLHKIPVWALQKSCLPLHVMRRDQTHSWRAAACFSVTFFQGICKVTSFHQEILLEGALVECWTTSPLPSEQPARQYHFSPGCPGQTAALLNKSMDISTAVQISKIQQR